MQWKLWLDDLRNPSVEVPDEKDFIWAHDVEQAKYYVKMWGPPFFMDLDHDLGVSLKSHVIESNRTETAMEFLRWLSDKYFDSGADIQYKVHSANPVGVDNIIAFMTSWRRNAVAQME